MGSENMVSALDQQRTKVDVSSLGDAELWVAVAGLTASRPQAEITAHIAASLEAFLAPQRQDIGQCRELTDAVDLEQRLRLRILRLREPLDGAIVLLDLHRHRSDLFEYGTECLSQTWRQHGHASLGEAQGGRSRKSIAAGLGQSAHRVHCRRPQPNDQVAGTDQRQSLLLGNRAMGYRPQDLGIEPGVTGQLLRIHLVALPITVRDRPKFTHVGHDHLVAQLLKLFADPDRVRSRLHRDPHPRQVGKPLLDARGNRSEPPPVYHFSIFVERAVMAPDIPKVDPDRHPDPGAAAWNFRNEVLRWLFHGLSLLLSEELLIPFFGNLGIRTASDRVFHALLRAMRFRSMSIRTLRDTRLHQHLGCWHSEHGF